MPGHWEGDLGFGQRPSAVGTLVERHSRYVVLFPLPDGFTAERMRPALPAAVLGLPQQLRRSLTWDQGREMAEHVQFSVDSGVQVYFCDPRSPWQRGTNENTNGLLRQYLSKSSDLRRFDQAALDAIAAELNGRLDKPSASRHPHRHSRRRCADPLRPPSFLDTSLVAGCSPRVRLRLAPPWRRTQPLRVAHPQFTTLSVDLRLRAGHGQVNCVYSRAPESPVRTAAVELADVDLSTCSTRRRTPQSTWKA